MIRRHYRVYLDANILVIWFLYHRKHIKSIERGFDVTISKSLEIWKALGAKKFSSCTFYFSQWTLAEMMTGLASDKIATKISRSGHSLSHYGHFKDHFHLTKEERIELRSLEKDFLITMRRRGIIPMKAIINERELSKVVLRYGIELGDAIHIVTSRDTCTFMITSDDALVQKRIRSIEILKPQTFLDKAKRTGLLKN